MRALFAFVMSLMAALVALPAFAQTPEVGYRFVDAENTLVLDTNKGRIIVEMYPQLAPAHAERMKTLTRQGFYNGVVFHRVIEGFMAQTGDPTGTGTGGSSLPDLEPEFTFRRDAAFPFIEVDRPAGTLTGFVGAMPVQTQVNELFDLTADGRVMAWGLYCQGALGMARSQAPNSANSQFFFVRAASPFLERKYTAFGMVVSGLDVVRKLKLGEPVINPDTVLKAQVLADMPEAERPSVQVMDTGSKLFADTVVEFKKIKGAGFNICDVPLPVKVTNPQ